MNPDITPGIKTPASAPPIESKPDNLGGCVGIGWGQGPYYNRGILSTYASFLLILYPGIKTLLSAGRRIESGQSRGMHGRRVGPNVTGGSYRPEHAALTRPLPSSSSMRVSIRVPDLQLQCRPCVTNMGPGDAWASVGCQIITGEIAPTYPRRFDNRLVAGWPNAADLIC
ncbi:unnamed protein product [Sphagnum balticum]